MNKIKKENNFAKKANMGKTIIEKVELYSEGDWGDLYR
jgi:hypothetical protein